MTAMTGEIGRGMCNDLLKHYGLQKKLRLSKQILTFLLVCHNSPLLFHIEEEEIYETLLTHTHKKMTVDV